MKIWKKVNNFITHLLIYVYNRGIIFIAILIVMDVVFQTYRYLLLVYPTRVEFSQNSKVMREQTSETFPIEILVK